MVCHYRNIIWPTINFISLIEVVATWKQAILLAANVARDQPRDSVLLVHCDQTETKKIHKSTNGKLE